MSVVTPPDPEPDLESDQRLAAAKSLRCLIIAHRNGAAPSDIAIKVDAVRKAIEAVEDPKVRPRVRVAFDRVMKDLGV